MNLHLDNPQLEQNWQNFCVHHAVGDWHGTWTLYSSEGTINRSFKVIRSLRTSPDGSKIYHQNHHFYPDGKTETKTYGPHTPTSAKALYLENSFAWGTKTVEPNSSFFFETGFKHDSRRASVVVTYDNGRLQQIITIPELLGSFSDAPCQNFNSEQDSNWKGSLQSITPDFQISTPKTTNWKRLEELQQDYCIFHFPDGIALSCPPQIESEPEFFLAVEWQATSAVLYRGIRYFDSSTFQQFTLQIFTP